MAGPEDTFIGYGRSWANTSNTPFREYKHWSHEGGISTPFIAYWPGVIRPGTMTDQVGHIIDLMPTCLDAAGVDYEIVPGVPSFAAASAALKRELTVPEVSQTVVLTRISTLSTAMPDGEDLATLARSRATMVMATEAMIVLPICSLVRPSSPRTTAMSGAMPNQAKKQRKKANHDMWKARI